jgi:hypothetical protein
VRNAPDAPGAAGEQLEAALGGGRDGVLVSGSPTIVRRVQIDQRPLERRQGAGDVVEGRLTRVGVDEHAAVDRIARDRVHGLGGARVIHLGRVQDR